MPILAVATAPANPPEPLVSPALGRIELAPGRVVWLYAVLASSGLAWWFPPPLAVVTASMGLAALTLCAGHSVGLHRGLIHQAYRCSPWLRGLLVYLFVHTGIGGPQSWIRLHYVRDYHQNESECPRYFRYDHSLLRDYVWNLHFRFVPRDLARYAVPEVHDRDPWLRFLERTWPAHVVLLAVAAYACWGLHVAITLVPVRIAVSVLGHWFVGYRAHRRGGVRYALDGSAEIGRNLPLLGILSFGEGFHNNHHAKPSSARMGEGRAEIDLGFWLLLLLERLGCVQELRATGRSSDVRRENARVIAPHPESMS